MAILSVQRPTKAGVAISMAAAGVGGDSFANDGRTVLRVRNAGAGPVTVTIQSTEACSFGVVSNDHDATVVVPNDSAVYEIGPLSQGQFNDPSTGRVTVNYSGVTGVTVAAVAS